MFNEWGIGGCNKSFPFQTGMLGNGARFLGPSASNAAGSHSTQQQHQSQFNRSLWPATFQANGTEFTVPVTDSIFAATGGFTQSSNNSAPYLPLPLELVKNWNTGTVAFSQANSSIFVQSHTDFLNCTASTAAPQTQALSAKKTETCIGRWEHGSLIEPLQIHMPANPTITSYTTNQTAAIKTENISSGSSSSGSSTGRSNANKKASKAAKGNKTINDCILNLHQQHQSNLVKTNDNCGQQNLAIITTTNDNGCSRTVPITWTQAYQQYQQQPTYQQSNNSTNISNISANSNHLTNNVGCSSADTTTHHSHTTTTTLLQIKREPCQVSEVTTSNNLLATSAYAPLIKIEQKSPTNSGSTLASITSTMDNSNCNSLVNAQNSGAIPIGIAVGRQRLQESNQAAQQLQAKDLNRFGLSMADLGCTATPNLSQNMFFTGTIPLTADVLQSHQSMAMAHNRTPPTLFQYPTMEIPMPPPPVGFQLVRDQSTGQILFLPTTTTIVTLDKINISCAEPNTFQQAVVWPSYSQSSGASSSYQPPHLLLPSMQQTMQQSLQPPPLAPLQLMGSDYLTASTTLHQSHLQHTQTHSTRLVAISDTKRTKCTQQTTTVPMPIPSHTLIKIEDGIASGSHQNHHHHQPTSMFEHEKSIQTSIATAVQTGDLNGGQLYYQHPGLIQIAPHPGPPPLIVEQQQECRSHHQVSSPSPIHLSNTNQSQSTITSDQLSVNVPSQQQQHQSEVQVQVQDANIQTSPVMSEDDNTSGNDEMGGPTEYEEESQEATPPTITTTNEQPSSYEILCQSVLNTSSETEAVPKQEEHEELEIPQECHESVPDNSCVTSSSIIIVNKMSETPEDSIPQTTFVESRSDIEQEYKQHQQHQQHQQHHQQQHQEEQREPVDLSGLQLLSNSIDVFHKKSIKQEPMDLHMHHHHDQQITSPTIASSTYTPPMQEPPPMLEQGVMTMIPIDQTFRTEDLGGLNLLCALAEQRINEESSLRILEIEANVEEEVRKRKHKHSSNPKKSSKKSKHEKEKKIKKRKHESSEELDDDLNREMADTLKRVKTKYDPIQLSSVDDVFRLMENDMKEKLATITRQCEEKRRELMQIKPDGTEKECSSSSSSGEQQASQQIPAKISYSGSTAPLKFSIIPALSPSFSSSSNSESLIVDIPKISSDTDLDDADVEKSKRKYIIPIKHHGEKLKKETMSSKKQKSMTGYILAPKSKLSPAYGSPSTSSGVFSEVKGSSWTSSICKSFAVKQEEQDRGNILKESAFKDDKVFSIFGEKPSIFDTKSSQKFQASSPLTLSTNLQQRSQLTSLKHHSKHKKRSRSKDRSHRKDKKKIDLRCVLTLEHLKQDKVRVLTAQGGLFYAGNTVAITAPDIYAITLDGERRNQQHIMSREDLLKDAILEVLPKSSGECPTGTRLCAFWSQQYRCLYPGTATDPSSPDSETDEKFVNVEFDDGDNGRIAIEDIRFLPSDYPIVEYDPNPLQSLNKRKRQSSQGVSDQEKMPFNSSTNSIESSNGLKREEKKRLKKIRKDKDKMKLQVSNSSVTDGDNAEAGTSGGISERKHKKKHKCSDELCKHRKHKKRRKHKKHHHREHEDTDELQHLSIVQNTSAPSVSNDSNNNEEEFDEDMSQGSLSMNDSVSQYEIIKKVDDPSIKEDTMNSSITESSGSIYQPKKSSSTAADKSLNKSLENCSRIAAFLPARQLWAWSGKGFKRSAGRVKKQFYRAIQRGKETISVGDSAVFLSTGRPDRPYIGHIESMWETANNNMVVRVKWFYHPEETQGCPNLKYPGALFESPHEDENDVQTISHKCEVLNLESYVKKFGNEPKQYSSIYDNNDTYYLAGYYDPTLPSIKMESEIPEMPGNEVWSISASSQI